jgi:hypothetical protein
MISVNGKELPISTIELIEFDTNSIYQKNFAIQKIRPSLADGFTLTSNAEKWVMGEKVELIPTNSINVPFEIHFVGTGNASGLGSFEIHLFAGEIGAEVLIGQCRTVRVSNQTGPTSIPIQTPTQPANTRISASVARGTAGSETIAMGLFYSEII